jgi:phosphate starvation-inducible protein PhoH and related proteins
LQETIQLRDTDEERALLGQHDRTLRLLRDALGLRIYARKGLVVLDGEGGRLKDGVRVVRDLLARVREKGDLSDEDVEAALVSSAPPREGHDAADDGHDRILKALDDTVIQPRTSGQIRYVEAMRRSDIVFAIGPAGTGKTYLAVAMAIRMMKKGLFRKLVLVRPAVEAGEKLGFLPGDLNAKVSPYVRPLYDAIGDFIEFGDVRRYMERDIVEVVPLAYMRGRTLDNAFIILDEGQNTTPVQMQMFLTRMGRRTKVVVTGDVTQTDLPRGATSGLVDVRARLAGIEGIEFCELGRSDIVRHPLVQRIVDAYAGGEPAT